MSYSWVSLLTDYGVEDGFVASCHGVVARIAPAVRVIDVTHHVPPGDVARGAAILAQTVGALPPAVHVAVVDPGVGTARRAVALAAGDSLLVGPDNGLLPPAADALGGLRAAHELANRALWREPVSATFHGRDVFSPVAAHLAAGTPLGEVGPALDDDALVRLPAPVGEVGADAVAADVLTVDRFGNVQLACGPARQWRLGQTLVVEVGGRRDDAVFAHTFAAVPEGELVAFVDSAGLLALAVNGGRAADRLGAPVHTLVRVRA